MSNHERILSKTHNFFRLYEHISGTTEIPPVYHFWCCVALISAALEDRCWVELFKDNPTKPNLYVGLIGPGSLGKGLAISQAVTLLSRSVYSQVYRGKLTFAHLIDRMGKTQVDSFGRPMLANPKLWLVMDEFKNAVGSDVKMSEELISLLTELYTASSYDLQTGTRKDGEITIRNACLNWLFGSNEGWLKQVLTKRIFESGFVARSCFIYADYNLNHRISRPEYPEDYLEVYEHLRARIWSMQGYRGRFILTPAAEASLDMWYHNRKAPEEEALLTPWGRQREMLLRFAMIMCVAEGGRMVLCNRHVIQALRMVKQVEKFTQRLLLNAVESYDSKPVNDVAKFIARRGEVGHSVLLKYMRAKRGYKADKVGGAVEHLIAEKSIEMWVGERGGKFYRWIEEGGFNDSKG